MFKRVIWQYWETKGHKPDFVDGLHALARKNSNVDVILLTPNNLHKYLPSIPDEIFRIDEIAHKADMIRTLILREYGGMWLDSDAIVLRNVDWMFDYLDRHDFVAFCNGGILADKHPRVRVNCFLSRKNGTIISRWVDAQHRKFPRVVYDWEEIGTDLLHPICVDEKKNVKVLPFEWICPVPWDRVHVFGSKIISPANAIRNSYVVMMSNKSLGERMPNLQDLTVEEIAGSDTYIGYCMRFAMDNQDNVPTQLEMIFREFWRVVQKNWRKIG